MEQSGGVGLVANDGFDPVLFNPFTKEGGRLSGDAVVGKYQLGDAVFSRDSALLKKITGGVEALCRVFVGTANGEADALISEGTETLECEAYVLPVIAADDGSRRSHVHGVDFDDAVIFPIQGNRVETGIKCRDDEPGDVSRMQMGFQGRAGDFPHHNNLEFVPERLGLGTGSFEYLRLGLLAGRTRRDRRIDDVGDPGGLGADASVKVEVGQRRENRVGYIA